MHQPENGHYRPQYSTYSVCLVAAPWHYGSAILEMHGKQIRGGSEHRLMHLVGMHLGWLLQCGRRSGALLYTDKFTDMISSYPDRTTEQPPISSVYLSSIFAIAKSFSLLIKTIPRLDDY
jgi:hypothetical protein